MCVGQYGEGPVPPKSVRVEYERLEHLHMFQSPDLVGLLIMHPDLRTAFRQIGPVVSAIIAAEYGIDEEYGPEMDFEAFSRSLESEQVSDGIAVYRHAA